MILSWITFLLDEFSPGIDMPTMTTFLFHSHLFFEKWPTHPLQFNAIIFYSMFNHWTFLLEFVTSALKPLVHQQVVLIVQKVAGVSLTLHIAECSFRNFFVCPSEISRSWTPCEHFVFYCNTVSCKTILHPQCIWIIITCTKGANIPKTRIKW